MDKSILIQYTDMQKEIKDLGERIEKIDRQAGTEVTDMVRASCDEYPYTEHNVILKGLDVKLETRLDKYKLTLKLFNVKLLELQTKAEEYIETINDSKMRQILRYRIIDKLGWTKIGIKTELDEKAAQKRFERFFNKL